MCLRLWSKGVYITLKFDVLFFHLFLSAFVIYICELRIVVSDGCCSNVCLFGIVHEVCIYGTAKELPSSRMPCSK